MKQYPRIRRAAKWGGLGLAGVCVAAWAVCWLRTVEVVVRDNPPVRAVLLWGTAGVLWDTPSVAPGTWRVRVTPRFTGDARPLVLGTAWWIRWDVSASRGQVLVPLWIPAGLGLAAAGWARRAQHRTRLTAGQCPKCEYDRSTLPPTAPCPECGAAGR